MAKFRGHVYQIMTKGKIYFEAMKFQYDKHLGKAFAAQQLFIAGLYHYGYIDEETFKKYTAMYSEKLPVEITESLTPEQMRSQEKLANLTKDFSNVLKQWDSMNVKAKNYWIKKAKENRETVPNAKLVLGLRMEPVMTK